MLILVGHLCLVAAVLIGDIAHTLMSSIIQRYLSINTELKTHFINMLAFIVVVFGHNLIVLLCTSKARFVEFWQLACVTLIS